MTRTIALSGARAAAVLLVLSAGASGCARHVPGPSPESASLSVSVVRPERRTLARTLSVPGTIEALQEVTLYAKTAGYLSRIDVDRGDRVQRGQVLAEISVPEMDREGDVLAAQLKEVEASLELRKLTAERLAAVSESEPGAVTRQQVDEAKAQLQVAEATVTRLRAELSRMQELMRYATIRAPFGGVVTERFVDLGALIQLATTSPQAPILTIMDMSTVRVFVSVTEREVPLVSRGTPARMIVEALPEERFEGTVTRYSTALDPKTRTMKTEIDFPNPRHRLRPGMFGVATLELERRAEVLTLPATALLVEKEAPFVFVVQGGKAKKTPIKTGFTDGIVVEVLDGLTGTESVIVAGKGLVTDGMPVRTGAQG